MRKYLILIFSVLFFLSMFSCSKDSTGPDDDVNEPPSAPSNPIPENQATSVSINTVLSWECSDPDNDQLTYDVHFGTDPTPINRELVSENQTGTSYDLDELDYETTYYWQIVASDGEEETEGEIWEFTTQTEGQYGTVTDIDGNVYQTLVIGDQEWMVENLKVTHYRNGDPIPNLTDNGDWISTSSGAYCAYYNDEGNVETYGYLYNWYAVNDSRDIAPDGWHVPSDEEIMILEMYLGMTYEEAHDDGWRGTNEGSKLAGNADLWVDGDLENDPEFGSSGFDFLPGGNRNEYNGFFDSMSYRGFFWSSSESGLDAWLRYLYCNYTQVYRYYGHYKRNGFSVRLVRD